MAKTLIASVKGMVSKKTNSAVETSFCTASAMAVFPFITSSIDTELKAEIQRQVTMVGTINTPKINCRIVLPFEIRAIKVPTKGDQAIHQPQFSYSFHLKTLLLFECPKPPIPLQLM